MKDLKLDRQEPWEGPGRDPRGDQWEGDDMEGDDDNDDQDEDDDQGPWQFIETLSIGHLRICSAR